LNLKEMSQQLKLSPDTDRHRVSHIIPLNRQSEQRPQLRVSTIGCSCGLGRYSRRPLSLGIALVSRLSDWGTVGFDDDRPSVEVHLEFMSSLRRGEEKRKKEEEKKRFISLKMNNSSGIKPRQIDLNRRGGSARSLSIPHSDEDDTRSF